MTTGIAGAIGWGLWLLARRYLRDKNADNLIYYMLKAVILLFFLPVVSVLLKGYVLYMEWKLHADPIGWWMTPVTVPVVRVLEIVWLIGAGKKAYGYIKQYRMMRLLRSTCEPCGEEKKRLLRQLCREMGIRGRICLMEGDDIKSPCTGGIRRQTIYLPKRELTEQELRIALIHELIHCQHKDYLFQWFVYIGNVLHWYNPLVKQVYRENRLWSEYYADYCAAKQVGSKPYMLTVLKMAIGMYTQNQYMALGLCEEENMLISRMKRLEGREGKLHIKRGLTVLLAVALFFSGSICTYAGTYGFLKCADVIVLYTAKQVEVEPQEPMQLTEYTAVIADQNAIAEMDTEPLGEGAEFIPDIDIPEGQVQSFPLWLSEGDEIDISIYIEPTNLKLEVGILNEDGIFTYVTGNEDISHLFLIEESGIYRVVIQNNNNETVNVGGCFFY